MATDGELMRGTVNESYGSGVRLARANLWSAGFKPVDDPDPIAVTDPGNYNGGICFKRVSRIQRGDLLFRFSDSKIKALDKKCAGYWWFEQDCFSTIRLTGQLENSDFTSTARSLLGILYEWGDMGNLVSGILTADFWCYKGLTGAVAGQKQNFSGPLRTDMVQIYVPGGLTLSDFRQVHDNVLTSGIV
jgi:hypothetical protein